jgi:hypothetical protein
MAVADLHLPSWLVEALIDVAYRLVFLAMVMVPVVCSRLLHG